MGAYDGLESAVEGIFDFAVAHLNLPGTFQTYALPQAHEGVKNLAIKLQETISYLSDHKELIDESKVDITELESTLSSINSEITAIEGDIASLNSVLGSETASRVIADGNLEVLINRLESRINRLLYVPIGEEDTLNGKRLYMSDFAEIVSADQIDGLSQRLSFFTNAISGKISDLIADLSTGITIDKTNPQVPRISQNRPFWNNIQSKPSQFSPSPHNHPISDVTNLQQALDSKRSVGSIPAGDITETTNKRFVSDSEKGIWNGKADLVGGLVPASQLPSYVDDILEFANLAGFPGTGETGKIYIAINTGKVYRWSGSAYIEIVASPGSSDAIPEGFTNRYFTSARETTINNAIAGKEASISAGLASQFWNGLKQWVSIAIGDVSGLVSALAGKADAIHIHTIANVTGLQTALDGKRAIGAILASDITQNATNRFVTDTEKNAWNAASGGAIPIGVVLEFAGTVVPSGFLLCQGQSLSRTTYASLFSAIGTTYGAVDGNSFNLPDRRANVGRGAGTSSGYATNVTIALGAKTDDAIENHTHGFNGVWYGSSYNSAGPYAPLCDIGSYSTTGASGRTANETRVKSLGMNYIIRFQ